MPEKKEKSKGKFSYLHLILAIAVSIAVAIAHWTHLYDQLEFRLHDSFFKFRGEIEQFPKVATMDIDEVALQTQGEWPWTRDKHAKAVDILARYKAKLTVFDVFFYEPSPRTIPKNVLRDGVEYTAEAVRNLLSSYDEDMARAMKEAGNVYLAQTFEPSENQDIDFIKMNTKARTGEKDEIFGLLKDFSLDYPEGDKTQIFKMTDIDVPLRVFVKAVRGVGFATPDADSDGVVRRYRLIVMYDDRIFFALGFISACDFLDVPLQNVQIVPGEYLRLPNAHLPDGTVQDVTIPVNEKCEMMVNWAGDYHETFSHYPYNFVVDFPRVDILSNIKKILYEHPEFREKPAEAKAFVMSQDLGDTTVVEDIYNDVDVSMFFESVIQSGITLDKFAELQGVDVASIPKPAVDMFNQIKTNITLADMLKEDPTLILEAAAERLGVENVKDMATNYHKIKSLIQNGGIKPEDHPLYFYPRVLDGVEITPEDIEGTVFFVGATAAGTHDLNPTPHSKRYPMVGLHVNAFNTIITGNFLERTSKSTNILIMFGFGVLVGLLIPRLPPFLGAAFVFCALGLFLVFSYFAMFLRFGTLMDMIGPVSTLLLGYLSITIYNYINEEQEKRFIQGTFGHFLSPAVVEQMVENKDMPQLGGEERVITAFFSDVAGFTNISESLTPTKLVALLNDYLGDMTDTIEQNRGTVDKFEGDAIIAFWGAPIYFEEHAQNACLSCLEMQKKLLELKGKWKVEGWSDVVVNMQVRMGINTGAMVVGNMGSRSRMDYTIMGDAVNLAARLEPINKQYGTSIMISDECYEAAKDVIEAREIDRVLVVGKKDSRGIYEVLAKKGELDQKKADVVELFASGIEMHRQMEWDKAISFFERVLKINSTDGPSKVFLKRAQDFKSGKKDPPADDWEGVHVLDEK